MKTGDRYHFSFYRIVKRGDRASVKGVRDGQIVYHGNDMYGCANDDSRITGLEHRAYSHNMSGEPFFTMPRCDTQSPPLFACAGIPDRPVTTLARTGVDHVQG